ncbi:hypothetical protein ECG_03315 [Echinococcus granulosus]|nr:hypothetical protein ECG_03315 [Echinococcus granulosus]
MWGFSGYCYDPKHHSYVRIPGYLDASFVSKTGFDKKNIIRNASQAGRKLKSALAQRQSQSFVQGCEDITLWRRPSNPDLTMKTRVKCLHRRQRLQLGPFRVIPTVVETYSSTTLQLVTNRLLHYRLQRYEVKWKEDQNASEESGFKVIETTRRGHSIGYLSCVDAMMEHSTNDIICLCSSTLALMRYDRDARIYRLLRTAEIPRQNLRSVFARGALRSYVTALDSQWQCEEDPIVMFYNHWTISTYGSKLENLLTISELQTMPHVSLSSYHSQPAFTAVGSAAYLLNTRKQDAYVAVGKAFSLLSFTSAKSELELIRFGGADASDIAHLQCLLSPNNERSGVIVGRVDGSVELWEDRQPKSAAVVYKESKGALESSMPPRPVVDYPSHSFVATTMRECNSIGIWHLQTGELVNLFEWSEWSTDELFVSGPPQLVMRTQWTHEEGKPSFEGPVLMAIHKNYADFFY